MGSDSNRLMPPNDTNIENILNSIKEKTSKLTKPMKKLTDSGTQDIFNMEPKKKLELKPELLINAPRGIKIQVPKQPPFKLTGEIVQRKHTDMQTEPQINIPKRKQLTDTGSSILHSKEPNIKSVSSVSTETNSLHSTFFLGYPLFSWLFTIDTSEHQI